MQPDRTSEDHNHQNGGGSKRKPAGVRANIAGLHPADERTETLGGTARGRTCAVDDAAVDEAAEEETGEHQQRSNNKCAVNLVDVKLVFDEAIKSGGAASENSGDARFLVVEDVGDVEAKRCGEYGDGGQRQFQGMAACVGDGSNDTCVEDRLEEVLSLVATSKGNGNAYPSADDRENREHHQRKEHDPRRLVDAVPVLLFGIGDHNAVAAGVGVLGGSVVMEIGLLGDMFRTKEGLEP